jgi:hypothetical protein
MTSGLDTNPRTVYQTVHGLEKKIRAMTTAKQPFGASFVSHD